MTHPALLLQKSILEALVDSSDLTGMIGGARIFDDVPRSMRPPYIVFGDMTHNDWSTSTEVGLEHFVVLDIWSREKGRRQVLEVADLIIEELITLPANLNGQALVNVQHEFTETSRDDDTGYFRASVHLRAVTEPEN